VTREKISTFDDAVRGFEERLKRELTTRWLALEREASQDHGAPPGDLRRALDHFFKEAEKAIRSVVHEYFPKLLHVAAANPQNLGNISPLDWTTSEVLKQVCTFLGVDENFDYASQPRDDSKLVAAAAWIALGVGELDEVIPADFAADFVLPGWAGTEWLVREALRSKLYSENSHQSLPPLSRAETLEWFKQREWSISRRLKQQIENDSLDGTIEAGKTGVPILDVGGRVNRAQESTQLVSFKRHPDGTTAVIPPFSNRALLNSYEAFWPLLDQIRVLLTNKTRSRRSSNDFQERFAATELGEGADINDYEQWMKDFGARGVTAKGVALVFLERKTGRSRASIKTLMNRARNERKAERKA
jgi:hypothetical protein